MSNFLRHLLERTLAPAATLQPRLASRFESGPAPVRFTEERIETGIAAPAAPAPARPVASPAPPAPALLAEISSPAASPPPLAVPPPAAPHSAIASVPAPRAATPVVVPTAPAPIDPPAQTASISAPSATTAREVFSLPPPSHSTLLIEHMIERIPESSPAPTARETSFATASPSSVVAPTIAPAPSAPLAASLSPAPAPLSLPAVAPAAPIVRVTIGRVDIRAIHAAPTAPVRAPAPERRPRVSLETYLSQRDAK